MPTPFKNQVTIIGDSQTGKTHIVNSKRGLNFSPQPTVCASYVSGLKEYSIDSCWDMSGDKKYDCFSRTYYENSKIFIIVFDLTNQSSFDHISMYIQNINKFCPGPNKPPIILVGNKADLIKARVVSEKDIENLKDSLITAGNNVISYIKTSAVIPLGIDKIFADIKKHFEGKNDFKLKQNQNKFKLYLPKEVDSEEKEVTFDVFAKSNTTNTI